ncbi:MAG: Fic family protein [Ruminococcus flavefaciens]|nr:Fic family protein [Ruminococcus flavefaciens]
MKFIKDRSNDYNANLFINELVTASKNLGILEAKINSYQFNSILVPMFHKKEAISSMYIEGTQTTISDVFENEVNPKSNDDKIMIEVNNHTKTLIYGAEFLKNENFSNSFIQKIHEIMMKGIISSRIENSLGKYKNKDNYIINSAGTVVFTPPSHTETTKYMNELILFMNNMNDNLNPLIKAAIIHAQFESIHPFEDGNGRVGRVLVSLYLYKAGVINFPFFYISEAISQDKAIYYNKLTGTRKSNYNEWIKFFLKKIIVQTEKHISYIDSLNNLYAKTKCTLKEIINSSKYDSIIECLFTHPVLTSTYLSDKINVSPGQAKRYLNVLEEKQILFGDDRKRNRSYYFIELLELARRN